MKRISLGAAGFLISLAFTSNIQPAEAAPKDEGEFHLRLLSYNVKGLPGIAGGYRNGDRFAEIGEELRKMRVAGDAPKIVVLQEAFVGETDEIAKVSGYPFTVKGPKASGPDEHGKTKMKLFNAGLVTLSEYKIKYSDRVAFSKDMCGTWDCYANKGVQYSGIEVPELPFLLPVMNTHLQATQERNDDRIKQMGVILRFMKKLMHPVEPFIFAGDFNTKPGTSSYDYWSKNSGLASVGEICQKEISRCVVADGTPVESLNKIDQHYTRNGQAYSRLDGKSVYAVRFDAVRVEKTFTKLVKGKPLSDHLGYQVDYVVRWYRTR